MESPDSEIGAFAAYEIAYDVAMRRLDEQLRQVDAIDNKIGSIMGAATPVIALFAGFVALVVESDNDWSLGAAIGSLGVVGSFYVLAIVAGIVAYRFGKWEVRPNWQELLAYSETNAKPVVAFWVAEACVTSLEMNGTKLSRKLQLTAIMLYAMAAEAFAAAAGLLVVVIASS